VHLVGFIIRNFVTMHGHMNVKYVCAFVGMNNEQYKMHGMYTKMYLMVFAFVQSRRVLYHVSVVKLCVLLGVTPYVCVLLRSTPRAGVMCPMLGRHVRLS
jgi:hypothetical protein